MHIQACDTKRFESTDRYEGAADIKLGRLSIPSPDGEQMRLVAVQPDHDRVIDLARAHAPAGRAEAATAEAASPSVQLRHRK